MQTRSRETPQPSPTDELPAAGRAGVGTGRAAALYPGREGTSGLPRAAGKPLSPPPSRFRGAEAGENASPRHRSRRASAARGPPPPSRPRGYGHAGEEASGTRPGPPAPPARGTRPVSPEGSGGGRGPGERPFPRPCGLRTALVTGEQGLYRTPGDPPQPPPCRLDPPGPPLGPSPSPLPASKMAPKIRATSARPLPRWRAERLHTLPPVERAGGELRAGAASRRSERAAKPTGATKAGRAEPLNKGGRAGGF